MIAILVFSSLALGQSLLDASQGRIGRGVGVTTYEVPTECEGVFGSQQAWLVCSNAWQEILTQNSSPQERMWAITAALRAGDNDLAFREFEPLLTRLQDSEEDSWTYLILESWILSSLNLHQEALSLLKSVPESASDWEGRNIVYANILHRQRRFAKRDRFWKVGLREGYMGAWTWWHRAQWSNNVDTKKELLEKSLHLRDAKPVHFLALINLAIASEYWQYALDTTLVGLSLYPESKQLLQKGVVIAQQSDASIHLNEMVQRFPEHTKCRLLQGAVLLYQQDFQRAWQTFLIAQEMGESSKLFHSFKISTAMALSKQLHHQTLLEAIALYPEQQSWKHQLEQNYILQNFGEKVDGEK